MSNRNLTILGIIAVVMVALAMVQSHLSSRPQETAAAQGYLIQGFDPDQITGITISGPSTSLRTGDDEQVILNRRGRIFVVASKDNYPALTSEINKLLTNCLDIQTAEIYTDNPANYKELGVTEGNATVVVKFYNADANLITGVVIGKEKERGQGIAYVRRVEDNKVYVTTAQIPWIKKRAIEYVEQELTKVKREDVNSVTVSRPGEIYVLRTVGDDNKSVILDNMPEGKKLKNDVVNSILTALGSLRFEDVNAGALLQDLKFDIRYDCRLKDSTVYTFRLAKDGDKWFARCDARFMDPAAVTKTQGEVESEEELKKKEAKLLARDAAEDFADTHKGWMYEIPAYKAENMAKPLADLLEDITGEGESNAAVDENLPEEAEEDVEFDLTQPLD